jgi:F-type H+-transporting ATPase subunit epsilon
MNLEIITPEKQLFSGKVKSVKFPGTNGGFEVLNNHAPIISTLVKGEIIVKKTDDDSTKFEINGGVIEMQKNKIIVLAE